MQTAEVKDCALLKDMEPSIGDLLSLSLCPGTSGYIGLHAAGGPRTRLALEVRCGSVPDTQLRKDLDGVVL